MDSRHQRTPSLVAGIETLVHSNVLISASATSVAVTTILLTDHSLRPTPLFIVFAATMFVYSANRFTDLEEDERNVPSRAAFTRRYGRYCLGVGAVLYLGAVVLALSWELPRAEFLLLPLAVAGLYSIGGVKRRLLVKNLLVGVSWGVIPLGVGVYYGDVWRGETLFLFAHVTAMLTVAAVVFDIKDIEGDEAAGIRTLPNVLGPEVTRRLATVANLAVAASVLAVVALGIVPQAFLAVLAVHGYVGGYIPYATPDRGPLFYGVVVDGEHIFLALVVCGLEVLPAVLPG